MSKDLSWHQWVKKRQLKPFQVVKFKNLWLRRIKPNSRTLTRYIIINIFTVHYFLTICFLLCEKLKDHRADIGCPSFDGIFKCYNEVVKICISNSIITKLQIG